MANKKNKNLDQIVNELMKESIFSALFFSTGINALKQAIGQWNDQQVEEHFDNLFTAQSIRTQIRLMHEQLFPKNY